MENRGANFIQNFEQTISHKMILILIFLITPNRSSEEDSNPRVSDNSLLKSSLTSTKPTLELKLTLRLKPRLPRRTEFYFEYDFSFQFW